MIENLLLKSVTHVCGAGSDHQQSRGQVLFFSSEQVRGWLACDILAPSSSSSLVVSWEQNTWVIVCFVVGYQQRDGGQDDDDFAVLWWHSREERMQQQHTLLRSSVLYWGAADSTEEQQVILWKFEDNIVWLWIPKVTFKMSNNNNIDEWKKSTEDCCSWQR